MANGIPEMTAFLAKRRSVKPDKLQSPGPTAEELQHILTIGARVPDHKKLTPWRFIIFEGDARARAGEIFADACMKEEKDLPSPVRLDTERNRLTRAPTVVAVISSIKPKPGAPEWEQVLSAGALCFNICLAANSLGYATNWLTEWVSYSPTVKAALGLSKTERLAGFVYMGQATEPPEERERPIMANIIQRF
jgi:nitroreductase